MLCFRRSLHPFRKSKLSPSNLVWLSSWRLAKLPIDGSLSRSIAFSATTSNRTFWFFIWNDGISPSIEYQSSVPLNQANGQLRVCNNNHGAYHWSVTSHGKKIRASILWLINPYHLLQIFFSISIAVHGSSHASTTTFHQNHQSLQSIQIIENKNR